MASKKNATFYGPDSHIVLTTLNARYSHCAFGLRYLLANLGSWSNYAQIIEFTIHQPAIEIAERLLETHPSLIGFGIYLWNLERTTEVVEILKTLRPDIPLVIGGPEVSYEYEDLEVFKQTDHLITGEADLAFKSLVDDLAAGARPPKVLHAPSPDLAQVRLPYHLYTDTDLAQRLLYVEASRGCPFGCEFCLSCLDNRVRTFPLEPLLAELKTLLDRGARAFKFVDRTFNLDRTTSAAILRFCLEHYREGLELHLEAVPDRMPDELKEMVARFPPGAVQLEIGIQTFTEEVAARVSRPLRPSRIEDNFRFLRENTGVHIHADLIVGLPGETLSSFEQSFNRLLALDPDEIQVGILKRLRGTPISRHIEAFQLKFSPRPPYEILETGTLPFPLMQRLKRFARYFDLYFNSGNFVSTLALLFQVRSPASPYNSPSQERSSADTYPSPFQAFLDFSDWLFARTGQTHQFALSRLYLELFTYLTEVLELDPEVVAQQALEDYDRHTVRRERLEFLRSYVPNVAAGVPGGAPHGKKRTGRPPLPTGQQSTRRGEPVVITRNKPREP